MKRSLKYLLIALLVVIIGLTLVCISSLKTNGPTNVAGEISSDMTWVRANSPYNLTENVLVTKGVQLTIEPGVTVNFNYYSMQLDGTLYARGSDNANITFNDAQITFSPSNSGWNEQTNSGSIIQRAVFNKSEVYINHTSPKLDSNLFSDMQTGPSTIIVDGGSPIISNNLLTDNLHPRMYGYVGGTDIEIKDGNNATIVGNTIDDAMTGILVDPIIEGFSFSSFTGTTTIENNLITNNDESGISCGSPFPLIIKNNTITNNQIGLSFRAYSNQSVLTDNNIYGNANSSITLFSSSGFSWQSTSINATYNWWGTTNAASIRQFIYDSKNDPSLGTVTFMPFLSTRTTQETTVREPNWATTTKTQKF